MDVLVTCKYEEDPIKNEGARVDTTLYSNFSDAQGQITLVLVSVSGPNLNSSKLSCMSSLPVRMRMIDSKMKELECSQDFSHYKSMGIFPDAQGQLTPQSLVRSGRISNSSKLSCMSSIPARMKKIQLKMKVLECSQDFSHYKSLGIFPDAQGQLTPQSLVRSGRISNLSEMLWMFSLPASMKKIRSKLKTLEWTQNFPHYNPMGAICCHGNQSSNPTWSKT